MASATLLSLRFVRWCNGSTRPFGGLCLGSNPSRTASLLVARKSRRFMRTLAHNSPVQLPARVSMLKQAQRAPALARRGGDVTRAGSWLRSGALAVLVKERGWTTVTSCRAFGQSVQPASRKEYPYPGFPPNPLPRSVSGAFACQTRRWAPARTRVSSHTSRNKSACGPATVQLRIAP